MVENKETTCWTNRTPMQMAMILILSIAIPFFVIMVIIYILFSTAWYSSEKCSRICSLQPGGQWKSARNITIPPTEIISAVEEPAVKIPGMNDYNQWQQFYEMLKMQKTPGVRRRYLQDQVTQAPSRTTGKKRMKVPDKNKSTKTETKNTEGVSKTKAKTTVNLKRELSNDQSQKLLFPSIAAILENLYSDDGQEQRLLCPAAIISESLILSSFRCLKHHIKEFESLSIRIKSNYWSKGGLSFKVRSVIPFEQLAAVKLSKKLNNCTSAKITEESFVDQPGSAPVWFGSNLSRPLSERKKFDKVTPVNVSVKGEFLGDSPLLDPSGKYLVGFRFQLPNIARYHHWVDSVISG